MKNRPLMYAGLVLLAPVSVVLILSGKPGSDSRKNHEKFLIKSTKEVNTRFGKVPKSKVGKPGEDNPDMAAYSDFVKTVDPGLQRVPSERLAPAIEYASAMGALKSAAGSLNWLSHPTDMGGRTRVLMADPNDPDGKKVFAGSVTGGLWVNSDPWGSGEWQPVDDFWPGLSVSALTFDPENPQVLYAGTGESQTALYIYRESSTRGVGLMKSTDGGITWSRLASTTDWAYVTDLIARREGGKTILYAGVASGLYKGSMQESKPSDGLFRSADGGLTWTQVLPLVPGGGRPYVPSDIELLADGSRIFIGTTYRGEDRRGAACILWSDNGTDWTVMDAYYQRLSTEEIWARNGIPYKYPGRVMLASSPSAPSVVYAAIAGGYVRGDQFIGYDCRFILKSTDKGATWSEVTHPGVNATSAANLAWHALALGVDPTDPQIFWIGGLDVCRTTDGGTTWQQMSYWAPAGEEQRQRYVHADIHTFLYNPANPAQMLIGTDGGIFCTQEPRSESPVFLEKNRNYSSLQFYSCAIHPDAGQRIFMGGLQDNGTLLYYGDARPTVNSRIGGGDGALCFIDQDNPDRFLFTIYYTWLQYVSIQPPQIRFIGGYNYNVGTFINAMDYDYKYNILYANGCHFTGFNANTLRIVRLSDDRLTPHPSEPLRQVPTHSPVPYSCIKWFENSGEDASTIYIGTEAGRLYRLADAPVIGELTDLTHPDLPAGYISSIDLGTSEDTILLTYSNYGVPSVWVSVDRGQNWKNVEANLPDMPVRWGLFHPSNSRQVMLATETGV